MVKFILFPASRGPFSFVFAELTDGTKRDLCHGSKLSLIQPPSMVVDGGFRNASLSSAEAPVSKHQRKKLERLAGALERENGSAGNDFFLSPSQRSPHALIFPLPSLRAPRVYFSQGPRLSFSFPEPTICSVSGGIVGLWYQPLPDVVKFTTSGSACLIR